METNINYTLVGAFVITLIGTMVVAIIWLSSGFSFEQYSTYLIYSQEAVSGLSIDSPVEFNGVDVGSVKAVELNHSNPQLVEVYLSIKNTTPVTQGTIATLTTKGITGITYVSLKDVSNDMRPLIVRKGQRYPVIKTGPSLFMRIDTTLKNLSTNLREVAESVRSVLDKENQQSIKAVLNNLERVTDTLAAESNKMATIINNTSRASEHLTPLLQASINSVKSIENQTLPEFYRALVNINNASRSITEVASEIKQNPSMLVRGAPPAQPGPGEMK